MLSTSYGGIVYKQIILGITYQLLCHHRKKAGSDAPSPLLWGHN